MNIILRACKFSDRDHLVNLANNRKIWDNLRDRFPHPYTRRHATEWIRILGHENPPNNFIIEVDTLPAGVISIKKGTDIARCSAELGYWVGEPFWRKGVATEAVRQMVELTFSREPAVERIFSEVFLHNIASQRVLEKNDFYRECIRKNAVIKNGQLSDDTIWVRLRNS